MTRTALGDVTNSEIKGQEHHLDTKHETLKSSKKGRVLDTVIDLTEDEPIREEPKRKRRRSSKGGAGQASSPAPKSRQKLRRSARLSSKATSENQPPPPPASTTTSTPLQKPCGFVFSAGGSSAQEARQPCNPPSKLAHSGWGEPETRHPAPPVFSAGAPAQNYAQNRPAARATNGYPSMRTLHDQAHPEASSFSAFGDSRGCYERMHVVDQHHQGPCAPTMYTIAEKTRNPFVANQNSFPAQQPFSVFSSQQPQQYDSFVAGTSAQSTQPTNSFVQSFHAHVPRNIEASSTFLNVPHDAVHLWNIARTAAGEESEDLCRYTGDERRAREDQLYTRLNEPATRLSKAILKLRRRIRTAQQSGHTDASKLQGQLAAMEGKKRKMLEEAAARMFLAQNRSRRAFSMIDLHRLTAPAAIKFLTMTLQKAADSLESGFPATGWGKHSKSGVGTLKYVVQEQLELACIRQRFNCAFANVNKGALLIGLHPRGTTAQPPSTRDVHDSEVLLNRD